MYPAEILRFDSARINFLFSRQRPIMEERIARKVLQLLIANIFRFTRETLSNVPADAHLFVRRFELCG